MFLTFVTFATMLLLNPARTPDAKVQRYPRLHAAARKDRVLIVAPHIDDEAIGAGGYAIDALANGADVYVVFLTAGDCNRFSARLMYKTLGPTASNYLGVGNARIGEARAAMHLLGIPRDHYFVLGYPDRGLRTMVDNPGAIVRSKATRESSVPYADAVTPRAEYSYASLMRDIETVMTQVQPTTVIAPVPFDLHPDHSAAAEITDVALDELQLHPKRLGYLVHTARSRIHTAFVKMPTRALLPPARMQAFSWATYGLSTSVQKTKTDLLMTYKSQRPYVFLLRNAFVRKNELFFVYPE
ncbi:MAG TPA: PIG-L family deacetylase [Thermoanaerobaculia bacterium]|jgi:LmbE family N-acetylglucosaminyl deacetylase|nr:PIG-L family deacetylase [Thermoanaerobaculia bacterium]